jgi:hypothetical protein
MADPRYDVAVESKDGGSAADGDSVVSAQQFIQPNGDFIQD